MKRTGSARWQGDLRQGKGTFRLGSAGHQGTYSFGTRFENEAGTNPEELIASAHASCFSMALAAALSGAGHVPDAVTTIATVQLDKVEGRFAITGIHLDATVLAKDLPAETLTALGEETKKGCPVSRALAAVPITLSVNLGQPAGE